MAGPGAFARRALPTWLAGRLSPAWVFLRVCPRLAVVRHLAEPDRRSRTHSLARAFAPFFPVLQVSRRAGRGVSQPCRPFVLFPPSTVSGCPPRISIRVFWSGIFLSFVRVSAQLRLLPACIVCNVTALEACRSRSRLVACVRTPQDVNPSKARLRFDVGVSRGCQEMPHWG